MAWYDKSVIVTVNNGDNDVCMEIGCGNSVEYVGALTGERVSVREGLIKVNLASNSGEIWIPTELCDEENRFNFQINIKCCFFVKIV